MSTAHTRITVLCRCAVVRSEAVVRTSQSCVMIQQLADFKRSRVTVPHRTPRKTMLSANRAPFSMVVEVGRSALVSLSRRQEHRPLSNMGKVHGSLARAGKVKGQTPKIDKIEKKKQPRGRCDEMEWDGGVGGS